MRPEARKVPTGRRFEFDDTHRARASRVVVEHAIGHRQVQTKSTLGVLPPTPESDCWLLVMHPIALYVYTIWISTRESREPIRATARNGIAASVVGL